jgi:hypothetical protein
MYLACLDAAQEFRASNQDAWDELSIFVYKLHLNLPPSPPISFELKLVDSLIMQLSPA